MRYLLSAALLAIAVLVPLHGVMFESDEVTVTEDGVPITDNSVLMVDGNDLAGLPVVVEGGTFRIQQKPSPQIFELRRMEGPVTTFMEWKTSGKDGEAYDAYIAGLPMLYTVTLELPVATDTSYWWIQRS